MTYDKPPCLKRFGFLPKTKSSQLQKKKQGRQPSERYYLKDADGVYLTTRELEISFLMATGCTVRDAAEQLELSPRTAEFYLSNIRRKLGVRNKQELLKILFDNDFFEHL